MGQVALTREYTIYKDSSNIYTKTSISSEDLLYPLPHSRFSNSGKYKCFIKIEDKNMTSQAKKLTVTGQQRSISKSLSKKKSNKSLSASEGLFL